MEKYRIEPDVFLFTGEDQFLVQKRRKFLFFEWWHTIKCTPSLVEAINWVQMCRKLGKDARM